MPIYVFKCSKCGHEFEQVKNISDTSHPLCERCSGITEKLISPCTFALVGGGWASESYNGSTTTIKGSKE